MKCGDVHLVDYPFTDVTGSKVRPVLVVSNNEFNRGEDAVVVPISSVPDPNDQSSFYISSTDSSFKATGLRQSSSVKWTKPLTISRRVVQRRLGHLANRLLSEVQSKIQTLFQSNS